MGYDSFPYWPPTSPQSANKILGNGMIRGLQDLQATFEIPEYRDVDVPIKGRPALSPQKTNETTTGPIYGNVNNSNLFDMFTASTQAEPASQVDVKKAG